MKSVKMDKVLLAKVVVPPRLVPKTDITPIENGFAKTCELVLGKKLIGKMEDYAPWLMHHTRKIDAFKSALSGQDVFMGDYCACFELPKDRLIGADETKAFGECVALEEEQVTALDFPDKLAPLGKIAFCSPEYFEGTTENIIACPTAQDAAHCAYSFADVWAKYCAYGFWPRSSEHIFGFDTCLSSAFCINAYQSVGLKRCLEMDNCLNCSDCLFGHNLENCSDCMFCLNAKNLKFAIGNAPVGKEQYMKVKAVMLESMRKELEEKKNLKWDIFNIASAQGKK